MNFGSIAPNEVEVGEQYQFESKYHWCVHATVIENQCGENKEKSRGEKWIGWKIRVDETFGGLSPIPVGEEFELGWDARFPHYSNIKVKPVGSTPDYFGFEGSKSFNRSTEEEA